MEGTFFKGKKKPSFTKQLVMSELLSRSENHNTNVANLIFTPQKIKEDDSSFCCFLSVLCFLM